MIHEEVVYFDLLFLFLFMHLFSICLTIIDPTEVMSKFHHMDLNESVVCYAYFHPDVSEAGSNIVERLHYLPYDNG